ncbi:unnamed protein product [Prorocentrum cordatum]|uniref:Uncharacterized protein n=1 Tax=Prorocentrum cordatum TaxID=2364126 RepID=A0ABN9QXF2_9DINO|nr:unnamed protein product [Polarella glacialis]
MYSRSRRLNKGEWMPWHPLLPFRLKSFWPRPCSLGRQGMVMETAATVGAVLVSAPADNGAHVTLPEYTDPELDVKMKLRLVDIFLQSVEMVNSARAGPSPSTEVIVGPEEYMLPCGISLLVAICCASNRMREASLNVLELSAELWEDYRDSLTNVAISWVPFQ